MSFLTQIIHQRLNIFCFIVEQIVCLWAAGVVGYVKLQRPQSCFGFAISFNDYNLLLQNILFTFAIQIDGRIGSEAPERLHIARFNSFANLLRGLIAPILAQQEKGGEIPCSICTLIPLFYYCFKCCHILSVNFRLSRKKVWKFLYLLSFSFLCIMEDTYLYHLASLVLPKDVLKYFSVVKIEPSPSLLRIHLLIKINT